MVLPVAVSLPPVAMALVASESLPRIFLYGSTAVST